MPVLAFVFSLETCYVVSEANLELFYNRLNEYPTRRCIHSGLSQSGHLANNASGFSVAHADIKLKELQL